MTDRPSTHIATRRTYLGAAEGCEFSQCCPKNQTLRQYSNKPRPGKIGLRFRGNGSVLTDKCLIFVCIVYVGCYSELWNALLNNFFVGFWQMLVRKVKMPLFLTMIMHTSN